MRTSAELHSRYRLSQLSIMYACIYNLLCVLEYKPKSFNSEEGALGIVIKFTGNSVPAGRQLLGPYPFENS